MSPASDGLKEIFIESKERLKEIFEILERTEDMISYIAFLQDENERLRDKIDILQNKGEST